MRNGTRTAAVPATMAVLAALCAGFAANAEEHADEAAPTTEESDALALYDDDGDGRITCGEARSHGIAPVERSHPAYEYMNDRDGDGRVCE